MLKTTLKIVLSFIILPFLWHWSARFDWIRHLEESTLHLRYFLRGDLKEEKLSQKLSKEIPNVIFVNMDNISLKQIGAAPIPLSFYAKTIYALQKCSNMSVLVSDVPFFDKKYSTLVDEQKVITDKITSLHFLEQSHKCILGALFNCVGDFNQTYLIHERPLPLLIRGFQDFEILKFPLCPPKDIIGNTTKLGLLNTSISNNSEDRVRWIPLYGRVQNYFYYALGLEAFQKYKYPDSTIDIFGDDATSEIYEGEHLILFLDKEVSVLHKIPLAKRQLMEINWFSSWKSNKDKKISLIQVLKNFSILENSSATKSEKREAYQFFKQFEKAIVFLGDTFDEKTYSIHTLVDSEEVPSITAHANLFKTLYWGNYIKYLPEWSNFLIIFLLNFFVASLTLYGEIFLKFTRLFIGLILTYFLFAFYLFGVASPTLHLCLPIITPLGTMSTFWALGTFYQLIVERRQRNRLKTIFGNYLSPELVSTMLQQQNDPQLGGVERNLTAYFSDIQNFSTFSELLPPELLVTLMNEYLTEVTNVILEEGGTLDKYIGDAVVAMFGAPFDLENHPLKACIAACRIQEKQDILRDRWMRDGRSWPQEIFTMRTRIGLCSGNAVVGNMGSKSRFNFTMMGDTVNIAARCESGAKAFGVYTLVCEDTYKEILQTPNSLVFRFIDRIVVKGRQQPLSVYELLGMKHQLKDQTFNCLEIFEQGIHFYLSQNWDKAMDCFQRSSALEPTIPGRDPGIFTNPSLVLLERCQHLKGNPPGDNWNGVFVMKSK